MYLRCFIGDQPKEWTLWIAWAKYCYNTTTHSITKKIPFELVYGRQPPSLLSYIPGTSKVQMVEDTLIQRDRVIAELRDRLMVAQNKTKMLYEQKHFDHEFHHTK